MGPRPLGDKWAAGTRAELALGFGARGFSSSSHVRSGDSCSWGEPALGGLWLLPTSHCLASGLGRGEEMLGGQDPAFSGHSVRRP